MGRAQAEGEILAPAVARGVDRFAGSLAVIAAVAAVLYFVNLSRNPRGSYIDESSVAYNAFTISQTGQDEHGVAWPLYFEAFGDYKNPVYVYLLAGWFRLTGPDIPAARLLSALGIVTASALLALLALRVSRSAFVAVATAIAALTTPWLFEVGRVVIEVAFYPLCFVLFALYLHRVAEKGRWKAADVFALSSLLALLTYTYSVGRLLGPLFAAGLAVFCNRERWLSVLRVWLAYGLWLVPLLVFADKHPGALTERFKLISYLHANTGYTEATLEFLKHYASNISLRRLLVTGDPNRDQFVHLFRTGHFLAGTFVLSAIGLWRSFYQEKARRWWRFMVYALVVAPVPASLTVDDFHMLRLITVAVILVIFAIAGLQWVGEQATVSYRWRGALLVLLIAIVAQAAWFQREFQRGAESPRRLHLFDAEYRNRIFEPAMASGAEPIYLADALAIPGYIQACWYATLDRVPLSRFVRLAPDAVPPVDALTITTEENCPGCEMLAQSAPYLLYIKREPARPRIPLPANGWRAELLALNPPHTIHAGRRATVQVTVRNASGATWYARERSGGPLQVSLGNHWLDTNGHTIVGDDGRSALLADLGAGEITRLRLTVNAPRRGGDYLLELDMVQEGVSWFALKGSPTLRVPVHVAQTRIDKLAQLMP